MRAGRYPLSGVMTLSGSMLTLDKVRFRNAVAYPPPHTAFLHVIGILNGTEYVPTAREHAAAAELWGRSVLGLRAKLTDLGLHELALSSALEAAWNFASAGHPRGQ
jgi:hypothetical protein